MTCDQYVYIHGEFAYRTDAKGVDVIREQLKKAVGTAAAMVVRDDFHRDDFLPMGATGDWLEQMIERYGPIITVK